MARGRTFLLEEFGSGGGAGFTINTIPKAGTPTTLVDSNITDTGTVLTYGTSSYVTQRFAASTGFGFSTTGATPTHFMDVVAGTLTGTARAFSVTGTLSSSGTIGSVISITPGAAGNSTRALVVSQNDQGSGYAATYGVGINVNNSNPMTGTEIFGQTSGNSVPVGNFALAGFTYGTTSGSNTGVYGQGGFGAINVGITGAAFSTKNSAKNIGVIGVAANAGTTPIIVGGFFGLMSTTPTFASAALMADNGATTSPIALFNDNGSTIAQIPDGGGFALSVTDPGAGTVGFVTYTGSSVINQTNLYAVKGSRAATTANDTWLKVYNGTTIGWIPMWTGTATP